jgi:hypothetical protein
MRAKRIAASAVLAGVLAATVFALMPPGVNPKGSTKVGMVSWANSLEEAKARAMKEGKPILHLQMFGKLSEEFC